MFRRADKGSRKLMANRESRIILLAGLCIAAWMKLPADIWVAFVVGVAGVDLSFMWGNSKEHAAQAQAPPVHL